MRKLGAILLTALLLFPCAGVSGAENYTVSAGLDVQDFSVSVRGSGFTPLAIISVIAVEEGEQPLQAIENLEAVYVGQATADIEGNLQTAIGFPAGCANGSYEVCLIDASGSMYRSNAFRYTQQADMETALERVNSASIAELAGVLSQYREELLLDMTEYDTLGGRQQNVAEMVGNQRPTSGFAAVYDLHRAFGRSITAVALTGASQPEELLRKYAQYFAIDLEELDGCTAAERAYAMQIMAKQNYSSPESVETKYPEAIFAGRAAQATTAGQLQECFLTTYREELSLDLGGYNRLDNPTQVFSSLLEEEFSGYSDARDKFYAAVAAQSRREDNGSGGSGGNSGGGGGGNSGSGGGSAPVLPDNGGIDTTPLEPPLYQDLMEATWAAEAVEYLADKGIVTGDGNGNFRPNDTVTRAEFIKMIVLAFEIGESSVITGFEDVADTDWYAGYVAAGYDTGIIKGVSETWFGASENITREDLAVMCARAVAYDGTELPVGETLLPADEETVSDYAKDAVLLLYSAGIINGNPDGAFLPQANATRAEAAKIVAGLLQAKEGN